MEFVKIGFLRFGLVDLIDVAVVSFLIYRILVLMKGTRAVQIIIGIFLIFLISFFAFWFQMEGLKWLITNIATVGLLVLVIVFQPELRGALARIGHNKFIRMLLKYEKQKTVDELAKGIIKLSELGYGGLIVLERDIGLKNFIETGKAINARVSEDLLVTSFTPYTPLHDGAAIIQGDEVASVACTLPLTQNPRYRGLYGMRHKAAIGVTEESDAIAICVSEENGKISVASEGRLLRNSDKTNLKETLVNLLQTE